MTTEITESTEDGTAPGEAAKAPRFSKKKKIIAAVGAVLLLGGGTAGVLMAGGSGEGGSEADHGDSASKDHGGKSKDHGKEGKGHGEGKGDLVEVAPMTVNLRTNDGQARFLKLRILLAAESSEDVTTIETNLPLIIDRYQPFLRELRPEDLAGSAAVYRLKEELILRAADTVGPGVVADVLIQDMVQQ